MGFTYRNPDRSTDPGRAVPGARSIVVAARSYLADDEPRSTSRRRRRASPATPGSTTTPRCGPGCGRWPVGCGPPTSGPSPFADDNSIVDREVAHRAGLGWFGKNANLLLPGAGSWFVLGCVVTTARYPVAAGAGRRRLRHVPPLPRRLPDRGDRRAGRDRRQPLPRLGAAEARAPSRSSSARRSATASTAATTARRSARPPSASADAHRRPLRRPTPSAWVDVLDLLAADDETLLERHGRWYIADRDPRWLRRNALVVLGNIGDPGDRERRRRAGPLRRRRRRRAAPSTPGGRARAGARALVALDRVAAAAEPRRQVAAP